MRIKLIYSKFIFLLVRIQGIILYTLFLVFYQGAIKKTYKPLRKRDRVFIFGSSYSLNNITTGEWENMRASGETMAFNMFYLSDFIDVDYHILREIIVVKNFFSLKAFKELRKINSFFNTNKRYKSTKFGVMIDKFSTGALLWFIFFRQSRDIFLYSNLSDRYKSEPIGEEYSTIPHGGSTIFDCINIAYLMGYKEIVLVGIDLKDSRYFYLPYDQAHWLSVSNNPDEPHPTQERTVNNIIKWHKKLSEKGVNLSVYSDVSLLAKYVPVYLKR
jgi:hypothetical protein